MTVLPVIGRELRVQSRLAFTYNLRVLGAMAVLLACVIYSLSHPLVHALGGELFWHLNCALLISILVLVPLLCADCISRERREGTVGLLFLTPLKARDVVLAKGMVHGLRALSLLLAALPVITIAILLGGVSWNDAVLSLIMNFSSLCWALAAGLLASSLGKSWVRSQLLALTLVPVFGCLFLVTAGINLVLFLGRVPAFREPLDFEFIFGCGIRISTDYEGCWGELTRFIPPRLQTACLLSQSLMIILSLLLLLLTIEIASRFLRRFWREEPPSAQRLWLEGKLLTPILMVSLLHRWMRRKLERNPIGWLEQRTWSGRLVMWGWFAVMISIYTAAIKGDDAPRSLEVIQQFLALLLLGVMAVTAAGSFRRERETGVMELLLVSPMGVKQIISGRLRGLWGQFLPAFIALLGIWTFLDMELLAGQAKPGFIAIFCSSFVALPIIGLYHSLRRPNFISAFLFTVFTGLVVPFGVVLFTMFLDLFVIGAGFPIFGDAFRTDIVVFIQLTLAVLYRWRLYRDMERRNFPLTRAAT
jgi:hypothetical protein